MKIQAEKICKDLFDESYSKVDDPVLAAEINDYMQAQFDLDEIMNDPALDEIRSETFKIINSGKEGTIATENRNFVKTALAEASGSKIKEDLKDIWFDIGTSNIDDISAEWVNEWHRKKQLQGAVAEERKDFITYSLEDNGSEEFTINEPEVKLSSFVNKTGRTRVLKFVSLSAAALLGAVLIIKTLQPSDPDKLFRSYYEPFNAVSPVVRGNNSNDLYISAMNSYKSGDYKNAAKSFRESAGINPSFGSPVFYLGLTALETGDYNEAIKDLDSVMNESGAYSKEAKWYLGLACLKTGNKEKARECFEELSATSGYYKERSEKILRHLK